MDQVVSKILREMLRDSSPTRSSLPLWGCKKNQRLTTVAREEDPGSVTAGSGRNHSPPRHANPPTGVMQAVHQVRADP